MAILLLRSSPTVTLLIVLAVLALLLLLAVQVLAGRPAPPSSGPLRPRHELVGAHLMTALVTIGVGLVMCRMGFRERRLQARSSLGRCASCGRDLGSRRRCPRCG